MSVRQEIEQVLQRSRDERHRLQVQKEVDRIASRDYARSVIKLVALESADVKDFAACAEKQHQTAEYSNIMDTLDKLEEEYQRTRYAAGAIKDKQEKAKVMEAAKAKRDATSVPLKDRLKEVTPDEVVAARGARKQLSTVEYKAAMESINRIWGERKAMLDPLRADLEVGKLCQKIGEEAKAIKHLVKAAGPYEKQKNLVVEPTDDEWHQIRQSEHDRMREAHYLLFHFFIKTKDRKATEAHMSAYLELSQGDQRIKALKYLERLLSKHRGVAEAEPAKRRTVAESILVSHSLGRLPDLRLAILKELNELFPNDPYLLESLGQLHVRLRDFGEARKTIDNYVALPQVANLPLYAAVLEFTPQPHFRSLSQGSIRS